MNTYDINKIKLPNGDICNLRDQSAIITKTVQNTNIIHIEDAAEKPLKECKIDIQPIQDFNGYDHPWPGGGGVNLLDFSKLTVASTAPYGMLFTKGTAEGTVIISGTLEKNGSVAPLSYADTSLSGKGYVFLTEHISGDSLVQLNATYGLRTETEKTIAVKFNGTAGQTYTETIRISVYNPPAPTSWTPYSNICPITGWTGVKLQRTGKNLLPIPTKTVTLLSGVVVSASEGKLQITGTGNSYGTYNIDLPYTIPAGMQMVLNGNTTGNGVVSYRVRNKEDNSYEQINLNTPKSVSFAVNRFQVAVNPNTEYSYAIENVQLELGSTATAYEPYQGSTYDLSFGDAGTVYGGTLDATNGVLTVNKAMMVFNGTESWHVYKNSNYGDSYWINVPDKMMGHNLTVCTAFENIQSCWGNDGKDRYGVFSDIGGYTRLYFKAPNANVASVENFKTWLTEHPIMVVYPLATSLIYHLTPLQVQMLLGENNIWSDTGASSCTYYVNSNLTAELAEYKKLQTQISDPVAENTATAFISSITQNVNGVITALKANLPTASTSTAGIVQLNTATDSTSTTQAATPSAVKAAYDLALTASNTVVVESRIGELSAAKITSGVFAADRIPSLNANKITSGTLSDGLIPGLDTSKITSGTLSSERLPTSGVTAGSYGPAVDLTLLHGDSFNVPLVSIDDRGRVTSAATKAITLPSYAAATSSADGLMSSTDKSKLDNLTTIQLSSGINVTEDTDGLIFTYVN